MIIYQSTALYNVRHHTSSPFTKDLDQQWKLDIGFPIVGSSSRVFNEANIDSMHLSLLSSLHV